jgi:hypothetical protein
MELIAILMGVWLLCSLLFYWSLWRLARSTARHLGVPEAKPRAAREVEVGYVDTVSR